MICRKSLVEGARGIHVPLNASIHVLHLARFPSPHRGPRHRQRYVFDDAYAIVNNPDARDAPWWGLWAHDFWGAPLASKSARGCELCTFLGCGTVLCAYSMF